MTTSAADLIGPAGRPSRVDVIEEQVSFVNRREVRRITKINEARPSAAGLVQMVSVSRGESGNLLDTIFDPKVAPIFVGTARPSWTALAC